MKFLTQKRYFVNYLIVIDRELLLLYVKFVTKRSKLYRVHTWNPPGPFCLGGPDSTSTAADVFRSSHMTSDPRRSRQFDFSRDRCNCWACKWHSGFSAPSWSRILGIFRCVCTRPLRLLYHLQEKEEYANQGSCERHANNVTGFVYNNRTSLLPGTPAFIL